MRDYKNVYRSGCLTVYYKFEEGLINFEVIMIMNTGIIPAIETLVKENLPYFHEKSKDEDGITQL